MKRIETGQGATDLGSSQQKPEPNPQIVIIDDDGEILFDSTSSDQSFTQWWEDHSKSLPKSTNLTVSGTVGDEDAFPEEDLDEQSRRG